MTPRKSIFVGLGFMPSNLLFLLPLLDGYSTKTNVDTWIFDEPLPTSVTSSLHISSILSRYNIIILPRSRPKKSFFSSILLILSYFKHLAAAFFLSSYSNRQHLLEDSSWFNVQLRHSVFDQALQGSPDGLLNITFLRRYFSALKALHTLNYARSLLPYSLHSAFLGHTVYYGRALLAYLRTLPIHVFAHGSHVIYRIFPDKDTQWSIFEHSDWLSLKSLVSRDLVNDFWLTRSSGLSSYQDALTAAKGSQAVTKAVPRNLILLHIFKDSPFNSIDQDRIFSDYVDWIIHTLRIISDSDESWLIKLHPSAQRWGENQSVWMNSLFSHVFGTITPPDHIRVTDSAYSNLDLFKQAKRVLTYRGTSHLEAACFGIKPIIISNSTLFSVNSDLVFKPKSLNHYRELLLTSSDSPVFSLSDSQQADARTALFIKEEVLSFKHDIHAFHVYRGDDPSVVEREFSQVIDSIQNHSDHLSFLGNALASGSNRTVSFAYAKHFASLTSPL